MTISQIFIFASIVPMLVAAHFFLQFYPPGYGYAEEKRNNRIAAGASTLAAGLIAVAYVV